MAEQQNRTSDNPDAPDAPVDAPDVPPATQDPSRADAPSAARADSPSARAADTPVPVIVDEDEPAKPKQSHPFYCPGCGRRWNFPTECRGQSDATPHPPIEVVSTDELDSDNPEDHTAAPASE